MAAGIDRFDRDTLSRFSAIIDVRSPAEFAEDHIAGAINLPVLDNAERARIGTIYVQESRFLARRVGAALVARAIARHLEGELANKPADFAPLIYCWRGGQRSNAMATVLTQVGWHCHVVEGGYRSYRRSVMAALYHTPTPLRVVLLDGSTGTGKTEMLGRLAARGLQTLDLEALANHRGSLFGPRAGSAQPSQKLFESCLLTALEAFDLSQPIVVEAESNKIGARSVPPVLWKAMQNAPRIELTALVGARAEFLLRAYRDVVAAPTVLDAVLARLAAFHGKEIVAEWRDLAVRGEFKALATDLMARHYDPSYQRSCTRNTRPSLGRVEGGAMGEADQESGADAIVGLVMGWQGSAIQVST